MWTPPPARVESAFPLNTRVAIKESLLRAQLTPPPIPPQPPPPSLPPGLHPAPFENHQLGNTSSVPDGDIEAQGAAGLTQPRGQHAQKGRFKSQPCPSRPQEPALAGASVSPPRKEALG